jgi:UDP-3-O-[3-hydroxymyristoyl] glucosamine N-acyltransferase
VIGVGACVGRGAIVRANAVVGDGARVGPRCEIGIGAVVGVDATVYLVSNTGWARHSGDAVVVLGEGVEIGPQTLVERGLVRDTYVGARTILGGQIYVGHDAEIGSDCLIMARCALGSDVRIGASTTIMACVSINPGVTIGAAAVIRGGSTVYSGVAERADVFGNPARPFFEGLFALGTPRRVKDLRRRVAELERAARTNKESRAARSSPSH